MLSGFETDVYTQKPLKWIIFQRVFFTALMIEKKTTVYSVSKNGRRDETRERCS